MGNKSKSFLWVNNVCVWVFIFIFNYIYEFYSNLNKLKNKIKYIYFYNFFSLFCQSTSVVLVLKCLLYLIEGGIYRLQYASFGF